MQVALIELHLFEEDKVKITGNFLNSASLEPHNMLVVPSPISCDTGFLSDHSWLTAFGLGFTRMLIIHTFSNY